jgi:hypothetical protein
MELGKLAKLLGDCKPYSFKTLLESYQQIHFTPLTVFQQNMALLAIDLPVLDLQDLLDNLPVGPNIIYKGTNRQAAIAALIQNLLQEKPDIVGLSELFENDERQLITDSLSTWYPFTYAGPDEDDSEESGGLLLLSHYPITDRHQTIYRQCKDEDCLSNKGVLHARIAVPGHPAAYDIFLTHLQGPTPEFSIVPSAGPGDTPWDKIALQLGHLSSFIQANTHPLRPNLLMGDLNVNGINHGQYQTLQTKLKKPLDLYLLTLNGDPCSTIKEAEGFTEDEVSSFTPDSGPLPPDSPLRHQAGERIDYLLTWADEIRLWQPVHPAPRVVVWQSTPGRDISDHYGIWSTQSALLERAVDGKSAITQVVVQLKGFHCLKITGGLLGFADISKDPDEVQFQLSTITAKGNKQVSHISPTQHGVDSGDERNFANPPQIVIGDPGEFLDIFVTGWEIDDVTANVQLGPGVLHLPRQALHLLKGRVTELAPSLLAGDGGEYVVWLDVAVS